jgi:phosphoribosylformylglycinamidine cyclo-ligase
MIDANKILPGDVLIGLPSSGLHSNGYSLARKVLLERSGFNINQRIAELGRTLAEELLEPTRIYAKITRLLFDKFPVKGAAHITGGGITGNLPRVLPPGCRAVIERQSWPVPGVFGMIQEIGAIAQDEMDRTFNNGLGMILVIGKSRAEAVRQAITKMGEKSYVIGEIKKGTRDALIRA